MSGTLWLVVAIAAAALAFLVVLMVSLVRHLKLLTGSLKAFSEGVRPLVDEIRSDGERAQERLQTMADRGAELRRPRPGRSGPGARLDG